MPINERWVLPLPGVMFLDIWDASNPAEWYSIFAPAGERVFTVARGAIENVEDETGRVMLATLDNHQVWYAGLEPASIETVRGARVEAGVPFARIRNTEPDYRSRLGLLVADVSGRPINPYHRLVGARDPLTVATHPDPATLDVVEAAS